MQINISTRHGSLSSVTQEKITAKLEKLSRFHERLTAVNATIDLQRPESPHVELRVSAERAGDFVATVSADELISATDAAIHKVEQQLRRHKDKTTDRRTSGPSVRRMGDTDELEDDT